MPDFMLGIDSGGTAVKVAVIAADGSEVAVRGTTHPAITPLPGHAERDPDRVWRRLGADIQSALSEAGISGEDIAGVGVTGYGNGLWLVDEAGNAVMNGLLTSDLRAASLCQTWREEEQDDETRRLRANVAAWPGKPMPLLAWLQRFDPETIHAARYALSSKDFLRAKLTGKVAGEVSDQSSGGFSPVQHRSNDPAMLECVGLGELTRLMPPLLESLDVAGEISAEAATSTGLRKGTPVSAGCSDNLAVMLGTASVGINDVVVMAGTWGLHQCFLDKLPDDETVIFLTHGLVPNSWLAIEGSPTSAGQLDWFVERFVRSQRPDIADDLLFKEINSAIEQTDPRDPPIFFFPYLNGAIDQSSARSSLIGMSNWHGLPHAIRGMMEGIAFEHRRHFDRLVALRGRPSSVRFAGGAAKSPPWRNIFAAALNLPLMLPAGQELGALGAAILASVAIGRHRDLTAGVAAMARIVGEVQQDRNLASMLDRRYHVWRNLSRALAPHWDDVIQAGGR